MAKVNQSYRANVAALVVDKQRNFLLTQLNEARDDEWDFAKGGMEAGETEEDTLRREIAEELGNKVKFDIIERSNWNIIYDWPPKKQKEKGFKGQARVSYWVLFKSGDFRLSARELRKAEWFHESELDKILKQSRFPEFYRKTLLIEWSVIKKKHPKLFLK